jgi:hypothetical protein
MRSGKEVRRGLFFAALVGGSAVALWVCSATALAHERYNDGCQDCHGDFTGSRSPKGTIFPGGDKHRMHRDSAYMATACDLCHTSGDGRDPFIGSSNGRPGVQGVGCTGCHGRDYGGRLGDSGVGLRAHHVINGVNSCTNCHGDDPEPLPEWVVPRYYGTGETRVDDPCNSGPDFMENWSIGDTEGLDNDGDDLYDGDDPDCAGGCVRDPAWICDGDVDGDGQVNPVDSGLVQAAFGSGDGQDLCNYDVDCDGQINPVDSGIVQSLFGSCDPPRDVCP